MCNFQIHALRVELAGFLGAKISSIRLAPSLPVSTARHVITFSTRQVVTCFFQSNQQIVHRFLKYRLAHKKWAAEHGFGLPVMQHM